MSATSSVIARRYSADLSAVARRAKAEAIQTADLSKILDCFAEFIIGRRFAPTRWLAMTEVYR
jgi:hypothetical protein